MKLTKFGKTIRKLRIEHELLLGSMAKDLGVSSSYLSSIEMGQREIPQGFFEKIKALKVFKENELEQVQDSIYSTIKEFRFTPKKDYQRDFMVSLARSLDALTEDQIKTFTAQLINKGRNG